MTPEHKKEIETVRKWNRDVLLSILNLEGILQGEERTLRNQLRSQIMLCTAIAHIKLLYNTVAYKDPEPRSGMTELSWDINRKDALRRYTQAVEDYDFLSARRVLINEIREIHVEQVYDLYRLLDYELPQIKEDDWYQIRQVSGGEDNEDQNG